jgi:glycosyltransferase involved in cell wall biosynthesis
MNILMISPQPFFEPRGTPISVYQRLLALSHMGYQIDLVTYHVGADVDIPGVTVIRTPRVPLIKHVRIGPSGAKLLLDILLFWKVVTLLLRRRYDVIHSHEEAAFMVTFLAPLFRLRHVYDMHSCLPRQLANSKYGNWPLLVTLFALLERQTLQTCDAVLTIDRDLEAYVRCINPKAKQATIENLPIASKQKPAELSAINALKSNVNLNSNAAVVYTGTLEPYQGLDLLLASAQLVRASYPRVVFVVVGGKPAQIEYWRQAAKERGVADCTVFVGAVSLDEAINYLSIADVLVSPRAEGTSVPLKIYSYLHSGKPIVATNSVAHTQVLSEEFAVLVAPTSEAVANGILMLLHDTELARCIGAAARELAEARYGFGHYVAKLNRIYDDVVAPVSTADMLTAAKLTKE